VRSGSQPIPGATLTATQGDQKYSTVTDGDGHYSFPPLKEGTWVVEISMFGFTTVKQEVDYASTTKPIDFTLQLADSPFLKRMQAIEQRAAAGGGTAGGGTGAGANGRTGNNQASQLEQAMQAEAPGAASDLGAAIPGATTADSNDSLLVQGSLSGGLAANASADAAPLPGQFGPGYQMNGPGGFDAPGQAGAASASPGGGFGGAAEGGGFGGGGFGGPGGGGFGGRGGGGAGGAGGRGQPGQRAANGQPRGQFGNRRQANQIRGQLSFSLNNSIWDAKPFSLTGLNAAEPAYAQSRFSAVVGGPLVIPKIVKDPGTFFFLSYFGTRARNPYTAVATVPTDLEREGNFSDSVQSTGKGTQSVTLYQPGTNVPFVGNIIPPALISPISKGLLAYIPHANQLSLVNNYEYEASVPQNTDNVSFRIQRNITQKDRLSFNMGYQRRDQDTAQPFAFFDTISGYGFNGGLQWTRNISPTLISNTGVTFNRNYNETTPYFANGTNVASQLGIQGTSSNPLDYGPPNLNFTNFGALSDGTASLTRNQSQDFAESMVSIHGRHNLQFGVDFRRNDLASRTNLNGRGTLNFTGEATSEYVNGLAVAGTGFDFADFLLGLPQSSSIGYGDTSTYFFNNVISSYVQDTWQVNSNLTLILGLRYEFFSPFQEKYGHLTNLDIGPDFTSVSVVTPENPLGPYSGAFPAGMIEPDYKDFSPRTALAWKVPHQKKSLLVRMGYGIYYNGQAYYSFPAKLAAQPPFATTLSATSTLNNPLIIADGFLPVAEAGISNTYAVNKDYRTPYAQNWNVTIQKELGRGFFVDGTYLGTKGTDLDLQFAPTPLLAATSVTAGVGASRYTYDTSVADSIFHALQLRATQRFRRGISFNFLYQWGKSIDDASTFGGGLASVAQNWLDLSAERGLSSFDISQSLTGNFIFTSPAGTATSRIRPDTWQGRLLKDWTLSGSLTAQTGLPLTARVLGNQATALAVTGGVGSLRADATGLPVESSTGFFNLAAFALPPAGQYGNAGRNTIPGPDLITVNMQFARAFQIGSETRRRIEFRLEANNIFNQVNITNLETVVNASNYGLPLTASGMRTLNAVMRFRF
jgi:outer membrane receptor protein involved in Fe transport